MKRVNLSKKKQLLFNQHVYSFCESLSLKSISLKIINILLGFFIATMLATIPGQTGDWGIIGSSIIVGCMEYISKCVYQKRSNSIKLKKYYDILNDIKIGTMYGLFVDSFKLGS